LLTSLRNLSKKIPYVLIEKVMIGRGMRKLKNRIRGTKGGEMRVGEVEGDGDAGRSCLDHSEDE
jgi:hypothetical protein